ncbi:hypothetical protein [Tropicimonas aquimaris]|uniref:Uncharacterized protein n=1 Tax=Tropicimonas aquimaris TaxID=914152 RepID=A0ABW3IPV7_9RHOB
MVAASRRPARYCSSITGCSSGVLGRRRSPKPTSSIQRFEDKHDLLRRPAANSGATPRYDWDDAFLAEMLRIHEQGVPATQAEWIGRIQEWFAVNSKSGEVPDERTIRRRLTPAWKSLSMSA